MKNTINTRARFQSSIIYGAFALAFGFVMIGFAHAEVLTRQLEQGMTGTDVSTLQTFLASDSTIYPQGRVTGFFGPLTFTAVSNFQSKNGIARVGRVGPITLAAINAQMGGSPSGADTRAPVVMSINMITTSNSMNVTWTTNEDATGAIYYSLAPIALTEGLSKTSATVAVSGTPVGPTGAGLRTSHNVNVPNLQSNTTYYYVVHVSDQSGNVNVSWPATFKTK
jgi:hypothetical protein